MPSGLLISKLQPKQDQFARFSKTPGRTTRTATELYADVQSTRLV